MCYDRRMAKIASRELRNETRRLLERVEAGEDIVITVGGRDVAVLKPVTARRRWMSGPALFDDLERMQADPGLRQELDEMQEDTTEDPDLPW